MVDAASLATTRTGAPYPAHSQNPKWTDNYLKQLAEHLEKLGSPKFATASVRDTKIPAPVEGDLCWVQDTNALQVYDGSGWKQVFPPTGPAITYGTTAPTGGKDGDVYLQIV